MLGSSRLEEDGMEFGQRLEVHVPSCSLGGLTESLLSEQPCAEF
jgi:hypothetical protein